MHDEQIQYIAPNAIVQESLWERTRKSLLLGSIAVSSAVYGLASDNDLPSTDTNFFNLHEHAAHLAPGIMLGYSIKAFAEHLPGRLKNFTNTISIAGVALIAGLFETQVSDALWYRNTTKDINDVYYTVAAGFVGALCLRNKTKQRA